MRVTVLGRLRLTRAERVGLAKVNTGRSMSTAYVDVVAVEAAGVALCHLTEATGHRVTPILAAANVLDRSERTSSGEKPSTRAKTYGAPARTVSLLRRLAAVPVGHVRLAHPFGVALRHLIQVDWIRLLNPRGRVSVE